MLERIIEARRRDIGGFEVGRVLPVVGKRMIGPYVFFDHMGPVDFPAHVDRHIDVRPHPHIGLSTLTYLFAGEITHRDSVGSCQDILPGAVNWMTAGRGITHSERFERAHAQGDTVHGIQAWVALPDADEETDPSFQHHPSYELPTIEAKGFKAKLAAGSAFGLTSPVKVYSPQFYMHVMAEPGARIPLPADHKDRAAYIVKGAVELDHTRYEEARMLVFELGKDVTLTALEPTELMLLGGEPLGTRYIEWNFVSSSKERIEQAKADWRAGRMKLPDLDHDEFIPLPETPPPGPPHRAPGAPTS